jgi:hypothetical protein
LSGWGAGVSLSYQSAPLAGLPTSAGTMPISNFLGYGPGPAQLIPGMSPQVPVHGASPVRLGSMPVPERFIRETPFSQGRAFKCTLPQRLKTSCRLTQDGYY